MIDGMHDIDGYRDELGGSQLQLNEIFDQLILLTKLMYLTIRVS